LSETILGLKLGRRDAGMKSRSGDRRLAIACTMALAGCAWVTTPMLKAQVVKAPRYEGGVEAPSFQLALPAPPPAITPNGKVVEDVVARVNDQIITRSDVERAEAQLEQEAQQNHMSAGDLALAQRDMLRDMIDEQLLLSKAKELGLNADADVIRKLDEIRKQNHMDSLDDLEKAAKSQGVNFEDFKAQIRNGILKQEVVRDEVGRKLELSDKDEQAYYKEHQKEFELPEQERLSEILVPLPENATPAEVAQAEAKANDLKSQIMKGADFAELAKKYSGGQTAARGGDLGVYKIGDETLPKVFQDDTFSLKAGETTQPVRTRQGFVILKVVEHNDAGPAQLKDVEPQIQEALYMQAMQPALREYLTKLREDSYINLAPGFVDSGASAGETVPQFTAYVPPPVKKKKPAATERFAGNARYQTASAKNTTGKVVPATATIDPKTGMAVVAAPKTAIGKNGKPKKIRKEKVRFGQAPRTALQSGGTEDADAATPAAAAPGAVMASAGTGTAAAVATDSAAGEKTNLDDNPLNAKAPTATKTRFAATEPIVKAKKAKAVEAKKEDKILATATPMTSEEKADSKEQSAALGLNGDTVADAKKAKKDKKKRVKGAPKQRLADQPVTKPTPAPAPALTANPSLAPTDLPTKPTQPQTPPNSSTPKPVPSQSDTTLPPATQPPTSSPEQGQPVPGTNPPN
jgi:peptidyl-prolyl cis-trans isomerase SurA